MAVATTPALELCGVTRRYGALEANRDVSLRVEPGTIHAVVGENGAGKSTLMRIAYGEVAPDAGRVRVRGREVVPGPGRYGPAEAIALGVGMVHQHFMLVGPLSVAENVVLGREPRRGALLDARAAAEEIRAVSARLGLAVDPGRPVEELSVGEKQRVELVKILWRGAEVLLLDEPTAVLSPPEVAELFRVLRALAAEGKAVVLVTHKLDEVTVIADRVTVLRRGRVVAELARPALDPAAIAAAMVGHEVAPPDPIGPGVGGDPVIEVEGLRVARRGATDAVAGVDLLVAAGEIVGIAGVEGNGQRELVEAIAGLGPVATGVVRIAGRDLTAAPPAARADAGLGHIPEDRHRRGLILEFTVAENLILGRQREMARGLALDRRRIRAHAAVLCERFDVRPPDPDAPAAALSGGNQQKLVVARELTRPGLRALVAAHPTRGVDLVASEFIRRQLVAARDAGVGVLLSSSDLAELRALADRIAVMYQGRIVAVLGRAEATEAALGALMTGAAREAAA